MNVPARVLTAALALWVLPVLACAQEFQDRRDRESAIVAPEGEEGVVRKPSQHSSVVVMMSENGLEIFSPGAEKDLGLGEKVLTEPIEHDRRMGDGHYDRKPHGGIRLFGWFF